MPKAVVLAVLLAAAAQAGEPRDIRVQIPLRNVDGSITELAGRVCRPAGEASGRLVEINHGAPRDPAGRAQMQLWRCTDDATQWFLARGDVVLFVLRRGYGATGGPWAEDFGSCDHAQYVHAGLEGARDIDAAVRFGLSLPYVRPRDAIVIGQSAGGWATIAYDAMPHPRVGAMINMAGGRGSHLDNLPNNNCHPERLIAAAARFGARATTPMLWIYARNDSYFGPKLAEGMHRAFTGAGGKAALVEAPAFANEGHRLFFGPGGAGVWGAAVNAYLKQEPGARARAR